MGDLNRRRGIIEGMEDTATGKTVRVKVPLSEMFGYATDLRSQTQGRASYSMEFLGMLKHRVTSLKPLSKPVANKLSGLKQ